MNQFDAAAAPMLECFTETPDFELFQAVPNRVPLDMMNPPVEKIADPLQRAFAARSSQLNFKRVDACPEDILNRILWHSVKGSAVPFPEWAITPEPEDDD